MAIEIDYQAENAVALIFRLAGFFRKFRIRLINEAGRGNSLAHMERISAVASFLAGAYTRAMSGADAIVGTDTDSAFGTGAIRGNNGVGFRIAKVRQVGF